MTLPEPEVLNSLVGRIFRIDDVTLGDPKAGFNVRYRGQILSEDTAVAYDQLAESIKPYNLIPLFRKEPDGRQAIFLVSKAPSPRPSKLWVNILMLVLTILSVMLTGAQPEGPIPQSFLGQVWMMARSILSGWPFALSLMGILLAHEFGHYLAGRFHKTDVSLPFFIPLPFTLLGTMGAFINMRERPKNRRILFDIGVAGPLAGMVVAIPVLLYGLSLSKLGPIDPSSAGFIEGNSLAYLLAKLAVFGKLLPAPSSYGGMSPLLYWLRYFFTGTPIPLGGTDVFIHPVALAGWAGLLVTALNLVPLGTLDGGHIVYSLLGDKVRKAFPFVVAIMAVLGLFWQGWWLWAVLLLWLGRVYAEPLDQITTLDAPRRRLAIFTMLLFVLVFSPVPLIIYG